MSEAPDVGRGELTALGLLARMGDALDDLVALARRDVSRSGVLKEVPASVQPVTLLETNKFRHLATVYNDSTAVLYVSLSPVATPDAWTIKLNPDDYYETPAGYTGPITGAWVTVTGQARVTELS